MTLRLRSACASIHDRVEQDLDLLSESLTIQRYSAVLSSFLSFYAPAEAQLDRVLEGTSLGARLEWPARRKTSSLRSDLVALDIEPSNERSGSPFIENHLHALGALYVFEGATLGGQMIVPHVRRRLGLGSDATAFFSSYGSAVPLRWKQFRGVVNEFDGAEEAGVIVESAVTTFDALYQHCSSGTAIATKGWRG